MKACRGIWSITTLIFILGSRWRLMVNFMPRPFPLSNNSGTRWIGGWMSWIGEKCLVAIGIRSLDRPARTLVTIVRQNTHKLTKDHNHPTLGSSSGVTLLACIWRITMRPWLLTHSVKHFVRLLTRSSVMLRHVTGLSFVKVSRPSSALIFKVP
jgi:hypothetical protein